MKREKINVILFLLSILIITIQSFGPKILNFYINQNKLNKLKYNFNSKIKTQLNLQEKEYYIKLRKLIVNSSYFDYKLLLSLINKYSSENYLLMEQMWTKIKIKKIKYFLIYSEKFNVGVFLPVFLPVFSHVYKVLRK